MMTVVQFFVFLCFIATATTQIYSLSLHDALPISAESLLFSEAWSVAILANSGARAGSREISLSWIALMSAAIDRKSTRLNSSHVEISYAVFCLKKKNEH